ncbi:hypothetical protein GCM10027168_26890 [Streptomyces capparidis]
MRVRMRAMVCLAVAASVALVGCDSEEAKERGAEPPEASASRQPTSEPSTAPPAEPSPQPSSAEPSGKRPSAEPSREQPAPATKEGAVQRYEQYLHALGRGDLDTVCEVAGPAAKKAQDQGFGPCTSTFAVVLQMISPAQRNALRTATVDPRRVVVETPARIEMPVESVKSSAAFSESDLGSYTLEFIDGKWYITD